MSARHTRGTWTAAIAKDGAGSVAIIANSPGNKHVLAMCLKDIRAPFENAHAECIANGNLIAAAPDLLAALKAANARLLARMHTDNGDDYSAYSDACRAIAKATGEQA